jgi:hypothetical protein
VNCLGNPDDGIAPAAGSGRLTLVKGHVSVARDLAPVDLLAADHVLYFWRDPEQVLS